LRSIIDNYDKIPDFETSFSRFPNTYYHSEIQNQGIRAIITERQQNLDTVLLELSDLDSVMDRLADLREHLKEKQERIIQSMNLHRGLQSALWRLPDEVLSETFVQCLPPGNLCRYSPKLAPLLLTRICRRWREVSVDMPRLWCRLLVRVDVNNWQKAVYCFNSWLKRSRGIPIALGLYGDTNNDASILQSLLQPYNNQISSLIMYDDVSKASELLLQNLPALRELTMTGSLVRFYGSTVDESISRLPSGLRSLRLLERACVHELENLHSLNPVWAHLIHVEICLDDTRIIVRLLQLGLNLSSITIWLERRRRRRNVVRVLEPVMHTKLQSLRIGHDWQQTTNYYLPSLFHALSLPNLRVLDAGEARAQWPHTEFRAFLARSNCPLESLTLPYGRTKYEQRAEYVAHIPSLEVFEAGILVAVSL
jgi:hypothetical protein